MSYKEEEELVSFLFKFAEIGYPKTKDEVIGIVRKAIQKKRGASQLKTLKERAGGLDLLKDGLSSLSEKVMH